MVCVFLSRLDLWKVIGGLKTGPGACTLTDLFCIKTTSVIWNWICIVYSLIITSVFNLRDPLPFTSNSSSMTDEYIELFVHISKAFNSSLGRKHFLIVNCSPDSLSWSSFDRNLVMGHRGSPIWLLTWVSGHFGSYQEVLCWIFVRILHSWYFWSNFKGFVGCFLNCTKMVGVDGASSLPAGFLFSVKKLSWLGQGLPLFFIIVPDVHFFLCWIFGNTSDKLLSQCTWNDDILISYFDKGSAFLVSDLSVEWNLTLKTN